MVPPIYEANLLVSRLEKLNELVVRSKPLRSWTARTVGDVEVELTTRRTLAFLSGQLINIISVDNDPANDPQVETWCRS